MRKSNTGPKKGIWEGNWKPGGIEEKKIEGRGGTEW